MTPDEYPRRHHLADGPLSSLYAPSPSLSSFGAASVIMCCSARPASSSAPFVLPEDRIGRNSQFAKLSILVNADLSVCLSASLTHPGVTLANFSTSDPWRLGPRQHRVPIALDADARPETNPTSRGAVC